MLASEYILRELVDGLKGSRNSFSLCRTGEPWSPVVGKGALESSDCRPRNVLK